MQLSRNFLLWTQLWNGLPATLFPDQNNIGTYKKRVYLHLICWQRTCSSSAVTRVEGGGDHFPSGDTYARLPYLFSITVVYIEGTLIINSGCAHYKGVPRGRIKVSADQTTRCFICPVLILNNNKNTSVKISTVEL